MERPIFKINTNDPTVKLAVVQTVVLCLSLSLSCVARSEPLCLFLIYRARAVYEHQIIFSAHAEVDREKIFAEFDKKCIGLQLQIALLMFMFDLKCGTGEWP